MSTFENYISLLKDLHQFIKDGKGSSKEANAIRDMMDKCWGMLSFEQLEEAKQLSDELFRNSKQE